jgi:hypothetical protein
MLTILLCSPKRRQCRARAMGDALAHQAHARVLTMWVDLPLARFGPAAAPVDGAILLDTDPDALSTLGFRLSVPSFHVYSAAYQGWPLARLADWHRDQNLPCAFERILPSLRGRADAHLCCLPADWTPEYDPASPFVRTPRPSLAVQMELCTQQQIRNLQQSYLEPGCRGFDLFFVLETRSYVDLANRVRGLWGWYAPQPATEGGWAWSFELSMALFAGARIFACAAPPALREYTINVTDLKNLPDLFIAPPAVRAPDRELFEHLAGGFTRQVVEALFGAAT